MKETKLKNAATKMKTPQIDEKLQAVVVLDTYSNKLEPLSIDIAECLLPIMGRPLIDYTLEFLISNKVEEIILFCKGEKFYNQIKEYLTTSKWEKKSNIQLYYSNICQSICDAIREIEFNRLFRSNGSSFILITSPGIIAKNIKMNTYLKAHKDRLKRKFIMTVMCHDKNVEPQPTETFIVNDTQTKNAAQSLQLNTNIYICDSSVPHFFQDYLDTRTIGDFFEAISDDISGYKVHWETFNKNLGSVTVVDSIISFYSASMTQLQLKYPDKGFYVDKNSEIGVNCNLANCFIGKNCKIGSNVHLANSIILDGSEIGDNCFVNTSIIAGNVTIGDKCKLGERTLFSYGCIVNSGTEFNAPGFYCVAEAQTNCNNQNNLLENYINFQLNKKDNEHVDIKEEAKDNNDENIESDDDDLSEDEREFLNEVYEVLEDTILRNLSTSHSVIIINSAKCSNFLNIEDVYFYLGFALVEFPVKFKKVLSPDNENKSYSQLVEDCFGRFQGIVKAYFSEPRAKVQLLDSILDFFATSDNVNSESYWKLLYFLYNEYDLLNEEDILPWYEQRLSQYSNEDVEMKPLQDLKKFVKWLKDTQ